MNLQTFFEIFRRAILVKTIMEQVILIMEPPANVAERRVPVSIPPRFRLLHRNRAAVAEEVEVVVVVSNTKYVLRGPE